MWLRRFNTGAGWADKDMFDIQNYSSFIIAILIFQLLPGPGTVAILNATARHGVGAGMAAVLGTLVGDALYMVAAVAGLAALMQTMPLLFSLLQWTGAAYLCWMGIQLLRAAGDATSAHADLADGTRDTFRQACLVSLTNPKVMLFFLAFFPLFLQADAATVTLLALLAHVTLLSLLYQTLLVLAGNAVARRLRSLPWARRVATRLAGIALLGFGLRLGFGR